MLSFLISLSKSKRCVVNCCILKDICVRKSKYEIVFFRYKQNFFVYICILTKYICIFAA